MEDALKILENGSLARVYARDLCEIDKELIYICPDCSTYLDLRIGYDRKYFAHQKNEVKKLHRENCPRYHDIDDIPVKYSDVSNMTGYALLLDCHADSYGLAIQIPQLTISEQSDELIRAKIVRIFNSTGMQAFVDIEDLKSTNVICPLAFTGVEFLTEILDVNNDVITRNKSNILRKTIGLSYEYGTLFHDVKKDYSKRIIAGSQVKVGKSYLYVTPYNVQKIPKGIHLDRIGEMELYDSISSTRRWRVSRVRADILNSETAGFFRNMDLELVYRISSLSVIWPPSQINQSVVKATSESPFILAYRNYGDDFECVYQINSQTNERMMLKKHRQTDALHLLQAKCIQDKSHFQIRGRTTPSVLEVIYDKRLGEILTKEQEAFLEFGTGEKIQEAKQPLLDKTIFCVSDVDADLIYIERGIVKQTGKRKIEKLQPRSQLVFDRKAWGVSEHDLIPKDTNDFSDKSYAEVIHALSIDLKAEHYISMPIWAKQLLYEIIRRHDDDIIFKQLYLYIKQNKIPVSALPALRKLNYRNGGSL